MHMPNDGRRDAYGEGRISARARARGNERSAVVAGGAAAAVPPGQRLPAPHCVAAADMLTQK